MVIPNIDHEHRLYGLPLRRSFGGPSARAARRIAGESGRVGALVVGGFRYNEGKPVVGSLLLGLYDSDGFLHHVGFTSTIPRDDKKALTVKLKKLIAPRCEATGRDWAKRATSAKRVMAN